MAGLRLSPRSCEIHAVDESNVDLARKSVSILHIKNACGQDVGMGESPMRRPDLTTRGSADCRRQGMMSKPRKSEPGLTELHGKTVGYFLLSM
jgi:hypothetical protein